MQRQPSSDVVDGIHHGIRVGVGQADQHIALVRKQPERDVLAGCAAFMAVLAGGAFPAGHEAVAVPVLVILRVGGLRQQRCIEQHAAQPNGVRLAWLQSNGYAQSLRLFDQHEIHAVMGSCAAVRMTMSCGGVRACRAIRAALKPVLRSQAPSNST